MLLAVLDSDTDQLNALARMMPAAVSPAVAGCLYLSVSAIAFFTYASVATWSRRRLAEREAYYRAETMKRIAEAGTSSPALEYLREQERIAAAKRLGGYKLAGLINVGVGLGVTALLIGLVHGTPVFLCGAIPVFVGLALLAHAAWFAPERELASRGAAATHRE
jgi:hypothetical protein